MKAAFLDKPGVITLREYEEPKPVGANEVRIRVGASGVCGSDVHFFEHGRIGPFVPQGPLVLGHELAGEVVETGSAVSRLKVGDRVAVEPGVPCFHCEDCKRGFYNICRDVTFLGSPPLVHGSFRETMIHHQAMCHLLPPGMSLEEGALIEPLAVAVHACNLGAVTMGSLVAVLGAGPIGLLIAQVARAGGASVIVSEMNPGRLAAAARAGAEQTIDPARGDLQTEILAKWGILPSLVFEAVGARETHRAALEIARPGGRVIFVGWSRDPEIPLNVHLIGSKELTVRGQFRYRNVFPEAIALAVSGRVNLKGLITHRYPLSDVAGALRFACRREQETVKIMVSPDGK